jgi:predicted MFS family arabinose efflux permease
MPIYHPTLSAFGGMLTLACAMGIGRFAFTPILPCMIDALHWTKADAGFVASAYYLGYLIGAIMAASSFVSAKPRQWLVGSLALSAATTAAMALGSGIITLSAIRIMSGVASALVIVCSSQLVLERLSRSGQGGLAGVHFAGVGTGIALTALAISALLAIGTDWREMWLACGAIALLVAVPAAFLVPSQDLTRHSALQQSTTGMSRAALAVICAHGFFGFGYVITATFLIELVRLSSVPRSFEPLFWAVVGITAIPSVAVWVRLSQRSGTLRAYAIACVLEAIGVAASVEWNSTRGLFFSAALLGGTFMGITALGFMAMRSFSGNQSQRMMGLLTGSFAVGQIIGPLFAGHLFELAGSFRSPSLVASTVLVCAAALTLGADITARGPTQTAIPLKEDDRS